MSIKYPVFVYRDKGPHLRPGGTYTYIIVSNVEELEAALDNSYVLSINDIGGTVKPKPIKKTTKKAAE